jgi:light-regulated signal transduction histidine kinase (bacteriophytochrome)
MSDPLADFGRMYMSALETYLAARDEAALSRAYELGRQAMSKGLGILEMASLHQAALDALVIASAPAGQLQSSRLAGDFFTELLSPFEMSFRGYRAASEDLQRLNESLQQQKDAVELASQELESFSYTVAHDLSSPLRRIHAISQLLCTELGPALSELGKQYVEHIRGAALDMATLTDDLLSLARVTRAKLHRVDVDLTALARRITESLRAMSPERDVAVIVDDNVHGNADPVLLAAVLENLLGNAWKFTSKRAHAEIRFGQLQRDGNTTYFVRDNGAGFDMAAAPKLFLPFQRLHAASDFEGTGIGLATVQRVVQRHDGQVWAESTIDDGATFYFTLGTGQPS